MFWTGRPDAPDGAQRLNGQIDASIAHGAENVHRHWPDELDLIVRLGDQNFADLQQCRIDHHIDADYRSVDWVEPLGRNR